MWPASWGSRPRSDPARCCVQPGDLPDKPRCAGSGQRWSWGAPSGARPWAAGSASRYTKRASGRGAAWCRPGANRPAATPGRCASARSPPDLTGRPSRAQRPVAAQDPSRCARALGAALRASLECDLPRQHPGVCQEDESCGLVRNGRERCRLARKRCPNGGATRTPEWTPAGIPLIEPLEGCTDVLHLRNFPKAGHHVTVAFVWMSGGLIACSRRIDAHVRRLRRIASGQTW
jgi:hypothetical protein